MTFPFDKSGVLKTISKTLTKHLSELCFPFLEFPFVRGHANNSGLQWKNTTTRAKII